MSRCYACPQAVGLRRRRVGENVSRALASLVWPALIATALRGALPSVIRSVRFVLPLALPVGCPSRNSPGLCHLVFDYSARIPHSPGGCAPTRRSFPALRSLAKRLALYRTTAARESLTQPARPQRLAARFLSRLFPGSMDIEGILYVHGLAPLCSVAPGRGSRLRI